MRANPASIRSVQVRDAPTGATPATCRWRRGGRTLLWALLIFELNVIVASPLKAQEDYRLLGSPSAPAEMTVYSDFECPYCRNFALAALPAIFAEFVDRGLLRIRYAFFPLAAIHPNAVAAAQAAHCAGTSGVFWPFHDYLFVRQPEWAGSAAPDSLWISYARNLGLDRDAFAACLTSHEAQAAVEADLREAIGSGATGTPTVVLNGESIAGIDSYEALRARILAAIEAAGQ